MYAYNFLLFMTHLGPLHLIVAVVALGDVEPVWTVGRLVESQDPDATGSECHGQAEHFKK
jgi:hypothetical protein